MTSKRRNPAMDIIRCLAFFSVVSVHFFLNSGFYTEIIEGRKMLFMMLLRSAFMVCVPLFMLLSGYLMRKKALSRQYYTRLGRTLLLYVLACVCSLLFKKFYLEQSITIADGIEGILGFSAARYTWYVEMYLGLFLIIPFLNILYNNIPTQRWKQVLILALLIMTSLPCVVNIHNFRDTAWWSAPGLSRQYQAIIPDWWVDLYPITYYFIGAYLSEYPLKLRRGVHLAWMALAFLANGLFNFYRCHGVKFIWGAWQDWGALPIVIQSVLLFTFLANRNYDWCGPRLNGFLGKLSNLCFGAYLVSGIFDTYFYAFLKEAEPLMQDRLKWYPVIVPLVYVCSLCLSAVLEKLCTVLSAGFAKVKTSIR